MYHVSAQVVDERMINDIKYDQKFVFTIFSETEADARRLSPFNQIRAA